MTIREWLDFFKRHSDMKIFHVHHLKLLTSMNDHSLRVALSRLHKGKAVQRICRGFYANPFNMPTLEEISGQIYQPSYVSLESALSSYGVLSQIPQVLTCVTTQLPRTFQTSWGAIEYHQMKGAFFNGFLGGKTYFLAEKEKALADYLYLSPPKNRDHKLTLLDLSHLNLKKVKQYLREMNMENITGMLVKRVREPQ